MPLAIWNSDHKYITRNIFKMVFIFLFNFWKLSGYFGATLQLNHSFYIDYDDHIFKYILHKYIISFDFRKYSVNKILRQINE